MAAVDLGSNSFHMVLARLNHGQLTIIDRQREMVRLAEGMGHDGVLSGEASRRALDCLARFGQTLRDIEASRVRVVGTNTLRKARDADRFLAAAEASLGHEVAVISGLEEARLIYTGVAFLQEGDQRSRLVIDIGGGSTELIIGRGYEPLMLDSLALGCVRLTEAFFPDGRLTAEAFERARIAVRLEFTPVAESFRRLGWREAFGSSGTARAAQAVAHAMNLGSTGITGAILESIIAKMIACGRVADLALPGLSAERAPVFPGGMVILAEALGSLNISLLRVSDGALREGLLYEMLGAVTDGLDGRDRTVAAFQGRFHIDLDQARRVSITAQRLFDQVRVSWGLSAERFRQWLAWASQLHEIGLDISHARYHQHGGYLLANGDMPGFSILEQQAISSLVGNHRRKLENDCAGDLAQQWQVPVFRLTVLLRLAVLLHRSRSETEIPPIRLQALPDGLAADFPEGWLDANPLSQADLLQEARWLDGVGFSLSAR